jgi:hypothetical protein
MEPAPANTAASHLEMCRSSQTAVQGNSLLAGGENCRVPRDTGQNP